MMQPPSAIAEPIVVNLTPPEVKVAAGAEPVEIIANVRNAGTTVDQFSIELENIDSSWSTVLVQSVSLFPGDSAPIPIRIHPPKGSNTRAGHYTFVVRARSQADPTIVGVTKGVVQVGSYSVFQMELAPKRVTGRRGKYRLALTNGGNGETQLELTGRDPELTLNFGFNPSAPTIQPAQKKMVPVTVSKKGFRLVGMPEQYKFIINARPVDGNEKDAKEVEGELVHQAWFTSWRRPLYILAALVLLFLWLLFKPDLNPCSARFLLPSQIQFYSGFACVGGVLKPFAKNTAPSREVGQSENPCDSGPGFTEVRTKYKDLVGDCVSDEWSDDAGNNHQTTTTGELLFAWIVRPDDPYAQAHPEVPRVGRESNELQARMYFIRNDGRLFTFVDCDPRGTFNDCERVEITPPQSAQE
ncbi:MAG TPA: hypothetical protein VFG99_13190 [Chloroflexia bacterium]|nr:hypothetical protein [Chloroflexia bacterium]